MSSSRKRKYRVLLLGYLLVWGVYFAYKTFQFIPSETASGEVMRIQFANFEIDVPHSRGGGFGAGGKTTSYYPCPEVRFSYKQGNDPDKVYTVSPQAYAFRQYTVGDKIGVIFPKGRPMKAALYSVSEFWLPPPYLIILIAISVLWTIIFLVIAFKPWRGM